MENGRQRVALVTGASSGIGKVTARALAREGYATVLADVDEEHGKAAKEECEREGVSCHFVRCDVSDEQSVEDLMRTIVSTCGRLDVGIQQCRHRRCSGGIGRVYDD